MDGGSIGKRCLCTLSSFEHQCFNEECEAIGSSDAGIYVGQSDKVIIRNNKAFYNVAGIESENSTNVEIYGMKLLKTPGLLIFNLPELTLYGGNVKAYNNNIYNNNLTNFAVKGSIVSAVPKGAGVDYGDQRWRSTTILLPTTRPLIFVCERDFCRRSRRRGESRNRHSS